MSHSTDKTDFKALRYIHLGLLTCIVGAFYFFDATNDLLGVNDLLKGRHSAVFAGLLDWTFEDFSSLSDILAKLLVPIHAFGFYPHGALPPVYFGFFYKFLDVLGVPFSAFIIQLPTALLSIATVLLFYVVLLRAKLSPWLAFLVALCLGLSPIFVLSARGIATYWAIAIVFNQVLALYAMLNLNETKRSKWLVSLAFVHILLSDVLSFLVFGALIVGYALRDFRWTADRRLPLNLLRHTRQNLALLASPIIYIPAILTVLFLAAVSAIALYKPDMGGGIPLYPVLMFWALTAHGGELFSGESLNASIWLTRIVHALGDFAPLLILGTIGTVVLRRTRASNTFLWHFSWIGALGFGILFYVIANDHPTTLYLDQSYILIPFLLLIALILNTVQTRFSQIGLIAVGMFALTALGGATASISLVWSTPVSLMSDRLIVSPDRDIWGDSFGFHMPNDGHRAAGYIARKLLVSNWPESPQTAVQVTHSSQAHPRAYEPFLIYSGLVQKGDWFANTFDLRPKITYLHVLENHNSPEQREACGAAPLCAVKTDTDTYSPAFAKHEDLNACREATFCAILSFGEPTGPTQRYDLTFKGELRQILLVRGLDTSALPPGSYEITELDERFESQFDQLWDYFPKRARYRTEHIARRLLGQE